MQNQQRLELAVGGVLTCAQTAAIQDCIGENGDGRSVLLQALIWNNVAQLVSFCSHRHDVASVIHLYAHLTLHSVHVTAIMAATFVYCKGFQNCLDGLSGKSK